METRKWLLLVGAMALTHILFQFLLLPYGTALRSLLPNSHDPFFDKTSFPFFHSGKYTTLRNPLTVESSSLVENGSTRTGEDAEIDFDSLNEDLENLVDFEEDSTADDDDNGDNDSSLVLENPIKLVGDRNEDKIRGFSIDIGVNLYKNSTQDSKAETGVGKGHDLDQNLRSNGGNSAEGKDTTRIANLALNSSSSDASAIQFRNNATKMEKPGKKKMRCEMPPKSVTYIDEMNRILEKHRRSSRAMRPRWSSTRDKEILAARSQIENAPNVVNDRDLYAPLFRNVSKFKRSYELMERMLKIYIYKDGKKPIFHLPIMKGLYASEGWFMKLMQVDKRFTVKDPRKAHLFYMPFSSRMLEHALYVRNSHDRTNLRQYLKEYTELISAKYPYFNRTNGADHFLVACHDWAPYETRHHMEQCIKALCNADVTAGFKIGRDVSLPETYVRSARNPLRDIGGKPPHERNILAFYAGSMHGYLRRILLSHWKDKDPSMKIFGPMPPGVASKMNYIQHMKSSKYCICPKGYEVNSPRVVESLFYECVPVIISDNFVPPFFGVLNWEAFSVILAEKDIPNLKEILMSISDERYLQLQFGVRKVQRHFLWHANPVKYDLFMMTLHSIWYNRVYQVKPR